MADTNRDIFIALIDAGLDESSVLAFIEGESEDAGAVVSALATDANLAELVWQLRADRLAMVAAGRAARENANAEEMIAGVLDQELAPEEIDAGALAAIEATGHAAVGVRRPEHGPVKVRRVRRVPRRARRVVVALASAAVVVVVLSVTLPRIDLSTSAGPSGARIAEGGAQDEPPVALAMEGDARNTPEPASAQRDNAAEGPAIASRPMEQAVVVASAAEALRLAQSGRLVVRVVSSRADSTGVLARQLSNENGLARLALVEGRLTDEAALGLTRALPGATEPIMASAEAKPGQGARRTQREPIGSYMLRIEPSERAFALVLAKLREQPGVTLELVGTAGPVVTPASAEDVASLAGEPASWRSRIGVPVVVEEIR